MNTPTHVVGNYACLHGITTPHLEGFYNSTGNRKSGSLRAGRVLIHFFFPYIMKQYLKGKKNLSRFMEYVRYPIAQEQLMFVDEIDFKDIFGRNNAREKILIF